MCRECFLTSVIKKVPFASTVSAAKIASSPMSILELVRTLSERGREAAAISLKNKSMLSIRQSERGREAAAIFLKNKSMLSIRQSRTNDLIQKSILKSFDYKQVHTTRPSFQFEQ